MSDEGDHSSQSSSDSEENHLVEQVPNPNISTGELNAMARCVPGPGDQALPAEISAHIELIASIYVRFV